MTLKYILFGCKYFELISSQSSYLNYNQWNQTTHQKCHFVLISHKDITTVKVLTSVRQKGTYIWSLSNKQKTHDMMQTESDWYFSECCKNKEKDKFGDWDFANEKETCLEGQKSMCSMSRPSISKSAVTSASSPRRVELVDDGKGTLIFSKLISSSKVLIQSGLFKVIVIVLPNNWLSKRDTKLKIHWHEN